MGEVKPAWLEFLVGRFDRLAETCTVDEGLAFDIVEQQVCVVGGAHPAIAEDEGGSAEQPDLAWRGEVRCRSSVRRISAGPLSTRTPWWPLAEGAARSSN